MRNLSCMRIWGENWFKAGLLVFSIWTMKNPGCFFEVDLLTLGLPKYFSRRETKSDFFFPTKIVRTAISIKTKQTTLYLYFRYKTENGKIKEMSAVTKSKGRRQELRANKRHLWFELNWLEAARDISQKQEKSQRNRIRSILLVFLSCFEIWFILFYCCFW